MYYSYISLKDKGNLYYIKLDNNLYIIMHAYIDSYIR